MSLRLNSFISPYDLYFFQFSYQGKFSPIEIPRVEMVFQITPSVYLIKGISDVDNKKIK